MWPLTVALGFVIAYFILKFARVQTGSEYIPGRSYYKSGPTVDPSPLPVDNALIGVGLETRMKTPIPPSVMDSGAPVTTVMMNTVPSPMMESGPPPPPLTPMMESGPPPPAPSPMMAAGNVPVMMTPVPSPSPAV